MNDNTPDLPAAVTALTQPHVLTRYTGVDHDHAWMRLVRPTTAEERAEAKQRKEKLDRTVPTDEWWCPFCETVTTGKPHGEVEESIDRRDDPPLLDQLEERVRSSLSDGGTPGKGGASVLVDTAAFDVCRRVRATLRHWLGLLGAKSGKDLTLRELLNSWHILYMGGVHPVGEDTRYAEVLNGWKTEILDLLDPPQQQPYMGVPCPLCGETRALRELEGEVYDTVALWAVLRPQYRDEGSYGVCRACNEIIARTADPLELRARMNGAIAPATRLTQTIAESTAGEGIVNSSS